MSSNKYDVDEELESWLSAGTGINGVLGENEFTIRLIRRALSEAWASDVGRDLKSRVGDSNNERIATEIEKRFSSNPFYPGVPFRARIEEVMNDLLLVAPAAPAQKPRLNKYGVNLNFPKPAPEPSEDCKKFAKAFNYTVKTRGIGATKPKAGIVTLEFNNGVPYEWPALIASRLTTEAINFGLLL